ncbi:putative late blight resistance protein homolog R1C-3 [Coffea eugenioides]|uniref:putative late blight resistance protein homolog R1C-3 n=1 Tax=Coffea eugenioides TaxID=49369 RepID=UPI000F609358|nr:putative late blight resistance protein homolog R1C-3 [Coffea eugenioides]
MSKTRKQMELMTCIDSILDKLRLLVPQGDLCKYDRALNELKVELGLVKTFLLCYWKLGYSWDHFQDSVHKNGQQFYSLLLGFEDDGLSPSDLAGSASTFGDILKGSKQEIRRSYAHIFYSLLESVFESRIRRNTRDFGLWRAWTFWRSESFGTMYSSTLDRLLASSSPLRDEFMESSSISTEEFMESSAPPRDDFMEFFHSLLENFVDILNWGEACDSELEKLLEPLQEKLVFLKNFILFARSQGKQERKLMEHCGVVALSAAHLCHSCWFFRDDNEVFVEISFKIDEVKDQIKPVVEQVRLAYISILESKSSSLGMSTKANMSIVGGFVGSLLGNLWEFLVKCPTWFTSSLKHQIRILYEGLQFLRGILMKQQEDYDGLPGGIKDRIVAVVNDAGIVIFSLYQDNIREASAMEIDLKLFCLLEKIKLVKAEIEKKYPAASRSKFPTTNALELIDLVLEKLKELESCEVDPIFSFAKGGVDFLNSYLNKIQCPRVDRPFPIRSPGVPYGAPLRPWEKTTSDVDVEQQIKLEKLQHKKMQANVPFLTSFLENNLEQHIKNEKHQLQTMKGDLVSLRSLLEENGEQHSHHEGPHALWSHVIEVAYKAEFVIESLLAGDISFYSLMLFDDIAREIKLVKSLAQEATKIPRHVPSQVRSQTNGASDQVSSSVSISTVDKAEVALQDEEDAIIDKLINGPKQLDIISIVGMAGLGKTFLARRVYRDPKVTSHFHIRAWCCISQTYCKKDLLLQILACINQKTQFSEMNQDDLADKLRKCLSRNKYLIVLDDVWDTEALNALRLSFPDHTIGSRILLTSRDHGICGTPHRLRPLEEPESWDLLQKKLAIIRKNDYAPELEVPGRQIAENCKGLPLSIVIISGILASLDRPCLIYFGAFSEDHEISIQRLMWLWIAEGFVQKNESESPEKIAEGYIMALINRSLVMAGKQRSTGGVKTCCIHDLLHVFCLEKAKDQNFLQLIRGYDGFLKLDESQHLRRLSVQSQPKHFVKSRIFCPRIRSLLHASRGVGSREVLYLLSFVFHLKLLRVLDLGQISLGTAFPSEISLLVRLRFLAILGWLKGDIPSSLERLSNLETFLVTTHDSGVGLSLLLDTLVKMQKLRHLHVRGALIDLRSANDDTECSSRVCNLDTFSTLKLYLGKSSEKTIMKFPNIRKLKCCLLPSPSEESTSDSNMVVSMHLLSQLESLKLLLGKVTAHPIEYHLPSNLKKLTLEDFSWSIMSAIRKLPNLEALKLLRQADGVKEWDMEGMEEEEVFPALKFLKLKDLSIVKWMGSGDHFPSLERLIMEGCAELEELPSCLQETLTLQFIEVRGCLYSAGDLVREIKQQQIDYGNQDLKILISEEMEESDGDSDGWSWNAPFDKIVRNGSTYISSIRGVCCGSDGMCILDMFCHPVLLTKYHDRYFEWTAGVMVPFRLLGKAVESKNQDGKTLAKACESQACLSQSYQRFALQKCWSRIIQSLF